MLHILAGIINNHMQVLKNMAACLPEVWWFCKVVNKTSQHLFILMGHICHFSVAYETLCKKQNTSGNKN
jgi:hypothetical protein